jgi:hypothetical protein
VVTPPCSQASSSAALGSPRKHSVKRTSSGAFH